MSELGDVDGGFRSRAFRLHQAGQDNSVGLCQSVHTQSGLRILDGSVESGQLEFSNTAIWRWQLQRHGT